MTSEEIIKLAKLHQVDHLPIEQLLHFYKAAFNQGLEAAAELVLRTDLGNLSPDWQQGAAHALTTYAAAIRALKK